MSETFPTLPDTPQPALSWVTTLHVAVAPPLELGTWQSAARRIIPITGGRFGGPRLSGIVLPGGADWQGTRSDHVAVLEARYTLRTDAGNLISVVNRGFRYGQPDLAQRFARGEAVPPATYYFMTVPLFETAAPELDWLTRNIFVGHGERTRDQVSITVWQVGRDPRLRADQTSSGSPT